MCLSLGLGCVESCAFQDYVNILFAPGEFGCIGFLVDFDFLAVHDDGIFSSGHFVSQFVGSLCGIVFQQVSQHFRACQVVDCHDFVVGVVKHLAECKTSDTAETIQCNFYCHVQ